MKFRLDGMTVYFPYTYVYPEQFNYMQALKKSIDSGGACVLEMPSGTGKTICLLALVVAYKIAYPSRVSKVVYCSRTIPEIEKTVEELRRLIAYIDCNWEPSDAVAADPTAAASAPVDDDNGVDADETGGPPTKQRRTVQGAKDASEEADETAAAPVEKPTNRFLGLALSARRNLCIHQRISTSTSGAIVDSECQKLIAPWNRRQDVYIRPRFQDDHDEHSEHSSSSSSSSSRGSGRGGGGGELCGFYEEFERVGRDSMLYGVYSLEDLCQVGKERRMCPYFLARHLVKLADVVVFSYQYVVDPRVSIRITNEFRENSVVIFDEAHNIDNVCIEALSINMHKHTLDAASKDLDTLAEAVTAMQETNKARLRSEYEKLVSGLARENVFNDRLDLMEFVADPVLPADVVVEAVPGNIRKASFFLGTLARFIDYLVQRSRSSQVFFDRPLKFLLDCQKESLIERTSLRFFKSRLASLLHTLEIADFNRLSALLLVADFATLVSTYEKGFRVIIEPENALNSNSESLIQLACLDAAIGMAPVLQRYRSVVITSGTLSPLDFYPRLLNFQPVLSEHFPMSLSRQIVYPMLVTHGSDQVAIGSKMESRSDPAVIRNYGNLLVEICQVVPDGVVCFFPSYQWLETVVATWNQMSILHQLMRNKLLFIESPDGVETALALMNYRKACDSGRGAILLSVARGKISEGIDFDHHYGRAVVMMGIPYMYTQSRVLKARLLFLYDTYRIEQSDFLDFDAFRTAAQCVGRVIRGKDDYGVMIFADKRYNNAAKHRKLPKWISQFLCEDNMNLSTDGATTLTRHFLLNMAQPVALADHLEKVLWSEERLKKHVETSPSLPLPTS